MRLKTYFASSVEAAMAQALVDLGPDALILNSRRAPSEFRQHGEYEVVFAVDGGNAAGIEAAAPLPLHQNGSKAIEGTGPAQALPSERDGVAKSVQTNRPAKFPVTPEDIRGEVATQHTNQSRSVRRLQEELVRLTAEVESLTRHIRTRGAETDSASSSKEFHELLQTLREAGFTEEFASTAIQSVPAGQGGLRLRALRSMLDRVRASALLGRAGAERRIVALVGPAGAGKSTLLAKLAARYGKDLRSVCQIVSLDTERIGAAEPLRLVASILGVRFQTLEDCEALPALLRIAPPQQIVLIDLPGFSSRDQGAVEGLAAALRATPDLDVLMVLPASMNARDMVRAVRFYSAFEPSRLAFTKLDEAGQIGPLLEMAATTGLPLSFLSTGPSIPEDLEVADPVQMVRRVFLPPFLQNATQARLDPPMLHAAGNSIGQGGAVPARFPARDAATPRSRTDSNPALVRQATA